MCGFIGQAGSEKINESSLIQGLAEIEHRGPNETKYQINKLKWNHISFIALLISLFPGGPGILSRSKPTLIRVLFTAPLEQYVTRTPPGFKAIYIEVKTRSVHNSG